VAEKEKALAEGRPAPLGECLRGSKPETVNEQICIS